MKNRIIRIIISFVIGMVAITKAMAQQIGQDSIQINLTNAIGMEFQLIEPGSMLVGRVQLKCPTPPDTEVALEAIKSTLPALKNIRKIRMVLFDREDLKIFEKKLAELNN